MQVRPQDAAADVLRRMKQVVVIVPIDADVDEAQHVAQEYRQKRPSAANRSRAAAFSSSTMMVMMIASTPSLNASSLFFPMRCYQLFSRPLLVTETWVSRHGRRR